MVSKADYNFIKSEPRSKQDIDDRLQRLNSAMLDEINMLRKKESELKETKLGIRQLEKKLERQTRKAQLKEQTAQLKEQCREITEKLKDCMDQACALILKKTGAAPANLHTIGEIYKHVRETASTAEKTIALLGNKKAFDPEVRGAIEVLQKCQSTISDSITITLGEELGAGVFGTVYNAIQTVLGRTIEFVKKVFTQIGSSQGGDVHEFLIYYTLRRRISKHSHEIASDPSLTEGTNRLPMLALTKEQEKFLAEASSPEDLKARIQNLMREDGIYLEKKPGESLQSCLKNDSILKEYLSGRNPQPTKIFKLFGDVCMGLAAADRFHIVHRDLHFGNIQVDIKNCDAYILDFGVAVDVRSKVQEGEQQLDIINPESPICTPQEAFSEDYGYSTEDHVDKYNSFGASPIGLQLFFGQEGDNIVHDYTQPYKKYAESPEGKEDKNFQELYKKNGPFYSYSPSMLNAIKWSREHFHKDMAANVKAANEALKREGFAGYTDEQCEKIVELLSGLSHPDPKARMTVEEAAKNLPFWRNVENASQEESRHDIDKTDTKISKHQDIENKKEPLKKHRHNVQKHARFAQNEINERTKVNLKTRHRRNLDDKNPHNPDLLQGLAEFKQETLLSGVFGPNAHEKYKKELEEIENKEKLENQKKHRHNVQKHARQVQDETNERTKVNPKTRHRRNLDDKNPHDPDLLQGLAEFKQETLLSSVFGPNAHEKYKKELEEIENKEKLENQKKHRHQYNKKPTLDSIPERNTRRINTKHVQKKMNEPKLQNRENLKHIGSNEELSDSDGFYVPAKPKTVRTSPTHRRAE